MYPVVAMTRSRTVLWIGTCIRRGVAASLANGDITKEGAHVLHFPGGQNNQNKAPSFQQIKPGWCSGNMLGQAGPHPK